jgi:hypothetical protein
MSRLAVPVVVLLLFAVGARFTPGTVPAITIDDVTTHETNFDIVAVLTATLAPASSETVRVRYATVDGTADTTDYVADSGTLAFPPGTTSVRIPVLIKADALDELDETLFVDLSAPEHATIGKARGSITIVDDDPPPLRLVDGIVATKWKVGRGFTRVRRLVVTHASAGAAVDVRCRGKGCPFSHRRAGLDLTRLFANAKLRPGATVTVEISSPGLIARVFEYRIRAGKAPRARTLCVPGTTPPAC